uniref:ATP-dependent RNA helicase DDX54-like n=1 Tax=Maylandia zebra TaxID=106582 RepID=UPI000D30944B|nr:ATP-dependent RNA helicase DDX54-like [Maylandia zebra]
MSYKYNSSILPNNYTWTLPLCTVDSFVVYFISCLIFVIVGLRSGSDGETGGGGRKPARGRGRGRRGPNVQSSGDHKARSELKTKDQIMKQRKKKQKHQFLQGGGMRKLRSKNKKWLG